MRGHYDALLDWPFRCKVTFMLLDQGPHKKHVVHSFTSSAESNSFRRPTSERNIGNGEFTSNILLNPLVQNEFIIL